MKNKVLFVSLIAVLCFSLAACGAAGDDVPDNAGESAGAIQEEEDQSESAVVFQGNYANVTYENLYEVPGITGCLYLQLQIENIGNQECTYTLADVYVNDSSCNTGTGTPVTAGSGKSVDGAFVVFTDVAIEDVASIEYKIEVRDSTTYAVLETSDAITK